MDKWKYFAIGHRDLIIYNPLSEAKLDEIVELCSLPPVARILDIACGSGTFLCRMAKRWGAIGTGVDLSPPFVRQARERLHVNELDSAIAIIESDGAAFEAPAASFDLCSCFGASWIWNGYAGTIAALLHWTKPGGLVVAGEPFFHTNPPEEYLQGEGFEGSSFASHHGNVQIGIDRGLVFLNAIVASDDDWDRYEGYQSRAIERYAQEEPGDPDLPDMLAFMRASRDRYLKWGRDVLGWAVYMYMKPPA